MALFKKMKLSLKSPPLPDPQKNNLHDMMRPFKINISSKSNFLITLIPCEIFYCLNLSRTLCIQGGAVIVVQPSRE